MADLEKSILSFGRKKDLKKLEALIQDVEPKVLQKLITKKLGHPDVIQLLNYIFMGLSDSAPCIAQRAKLVEHILESLNEKNVSTSDTNAIISRLSSEVVKLKPSHMMRLSQWCVQSIQKSEQKYMVWKDLLPKLLNTLITIDSVDHSGTELTGSEYKRQVINSLCVTSWSSEIITSLAGMFIDLEMSPDEHLQVICKLCEGIEHLEPSSVPPLVHQLLLMSQDQHGLPVFLHLQKYFTRGLYNRIRSGAQESNSDDFVSEDLMKGSRQEFLRAESTILFYISQSANVGHANVRDFLNSLKYTTAAPEVCLNPFYLTVLLSLTFVSSCEDQVFDIIKNSISRLLYEENRRDHSAWLQDNTHKSCDLDKLITQLIESCGRERELVREGLVKLGFALLRTGINRAKEGKRPVWKIGRLILVRLVRKHYSVVTTVIELIYNQIIIGSHIYQHVDTLLKLSHSTPLLLSECQTILKLLVEHLLQSPGPIAQQVVVCLMPLARTFPSLRDCLMLVLRKAVFSCNKGMRLMAVKGFLLLLKTLDTKSLAIATQSSQSSQSSLSQVHSELIEGGESVGFEVVGVLRKCVMQQLEIRLALYTGLFDAVSKSPTLHPPVLDLLEELLKNVYVSDETVQPPLNFEKAIYVKEMDVILMEPIAHLVFVSQQFVTRLQEMGEIENTTSLKSLQNILDLLCKRMSMCTLENLGLEKGVNFNDVVPESKRLYEIHNQALGVYEALMAYILAGWSQDSTDRHQELINLFRTYSKLIEFGKASVKPVKSEKKGPQVKKNNLDKSHNEKSILKGKSATSKPVTLVLDMKAVILKLETLFSESVSWAKAEHIQPLRSRREFCRYALQNTLQLLHQVHNAAHADIRSNSRLFGYCSEIGRILYRRFLHVVEDSVSVDASGDAQVFVLAVECINELLGTVTSHFGNQLPQFLEIIGGVQYSQGLGAQLHVPINSVQKQLVSSLKVDSDVDSDPILKKLPLYFISLLSQLALNLPRHSSQISQLFSWFKNFVKETTVYNVAVTKELLSLLFKLQIHYRVDGALFDNVALQLLNLMGAIDEDAVPEAVQQYAIISEVTQIVCLQQLCGAIKIMIDDVEWMITRLKGEYAARAYPSDVSQEKRIQQLCKEERDVCSHISHCVKLVTILSRISFPEGSADAVLKLLVNIYSTVSRLAVYFTNRSCKSDLAFQAARFSSVIHLTAVGLAKHVQWLLLHVMADPEDEEEKKSKKGNKMKLAKELRDSKIVPKIVYSMEVFEKNVIHLSKKCNVNLMERMKILSGRDFRIKMDMVESVVQQEQENVDEEVEEERQDEEMESEAGDEQDMEETDNQENEPPSSAQPARKKQRVS